MQETALLELRGICKFFPGVRALDGVDFTLCKGEIHALMGENGAGKSTLIKVLTGVYSKDEGTISMEGTPVQIRTTQDALKAGISTVYQEITLCPNLTVAENLYIGRTKGAFTNWRKMNAGAKKLLSSLGIPAAPTQQLSSCSIAVQQMVPVQIRTTQDALKAGISTVYQEITLCPNLTVAENLYIGRTKGAFTNWRKMNAGAKKLLSSLGIPAAPTQQLSSCSIAVQQMVAIARAVDMECKVLILDEPTSSLDEQEVEKLFKLMLDLKSRGVGIIFVTHFLEQVYAVCDRITVLRDGKLVGEYKIAELPRVQLVSKMLGKELDDLSEIKTEGAEDALENAEVVYEASGLSSAAGVRPFDFSIRKGEVNGFTGLLGSGRSESVRAIFGADHVSSGTVKMGGKLVKITSPLAAMKHGISYLPEDRKRDGIIGDLSVRDNIILARQVLDGFFHPISKAKAEKYAEEYIRLLSIKTASTDTPIKSLSGGNQQKVILARWLLANPVYMILDEPTRGIDVGTKVEIQKLVLQLAAEGKSVTFISSEIDEMLRVCSRLVVMRDRQVVGELRGSDLNQSSIMKTIAGGEQA